MNQNSKTQRQILVNITPFERRIAILDDNHLSEVFYDHPEDAVLLGSIYKGRVNAVLPGLQAAFVDLGTDKAGFLHVDDVGDRTRKLSKEYDDEEGEGKAPAQPDTIDKLLKVGQQIFVQITKEPIGTKGPRLTSHITLAGRFLVCMPNTDFVGVSKKSRDMGRRRELRKMVQNLKGEGIGYIVRTLGLEESEEEFKTQMNILEGKWALCKERYAQLEGPGPVYRDSNFAETTLRDYFSSNVVKVIIDDKDEFENIKDYLRVLSPDLVEKVTLHLGRNSIFDHYGLEEELEKIFETRVYLRRGGYLVIDQAEALVAIDVNTGGKVKGKDQGKNILETNIDAAWEIAKQMRLRDLGGLIVIDFIDMDNPKDNELVELEFKRAIKPDKSPVHFASISQFGLMELTRRRVRPNVLMGQSKLCPECHGNKYIPKKQNVLANIDRWFHRSKAKCNIKEFSLALSPKMIDAVLADRGGIVKYWERKYGYKINLLLDEESSFGDFRVFNTATDDDITGVYVTSYSMEELEKTPESTAA